MIDHIRVLSVVLLVRAFIEGLAGTYLVLMAAEWSAASGWLRLRGKPEPGDQEVFRAIGIALIVIGCLRLVQAIGSLRVREWARKAGLVLAALDFLTPVTLPFAFWALVVYRNQETRDYFRTHGRRRDDRRRREERKPAPAGGAGSR